MSNSDNPIGVAVIDRDRDRCRSMAKAFSGIHNLQTFAWCIDGEGIWEPQAPGVAVISLVICHYGAAEQKVLKDINSSATIFYGGGGGATIPYRYVIWREITGKRNALTTYEAQELFEFSKLKPEKRTGENVPNILKREARYLLHSLAVICQAYLALDDRLNDDGDAGTRYSGLMLDRAFCQDQLDRLSRPSWWHSVFGDPLPLEQMEKQGWNKTRGNFGKVIEFNQCLTQGRIVTRATVEALFAALTQQLRS